MKSIRQVRLQISKIAINIFVYLSTKEIDSFLSKINRDTRLIVIEPTPGIFWDKHFEGVKLYYRKLNTLIEETNIEKSTLTSHSTDYGISIFNKFYLFPLSYCAIFKIQKKSVPNKSSIVQSP